MSNETQWLRGKPYHRSAEALAKALGNKRVRVYKNLHLDCWSIKSMEGEDKGKVIAYSDEVAMHTVEFIVSVAGRKRVLREKKKNVHAYVDGRVRKPMESPTYTDDFFGLRYNPYEGAAFVDEYQRQWWSVYYCHLNHGGGVVATNIVPTKGEF
jgi:hypothetical protein